MTWPEYFSFDLDIFAGVNTQYRFWDDRDENAYEYTDPSFATCPYDVGLTYNYNNTIGSIQASGVLEKWTGSTTYDPLGLTGPPSNVGSTCWWQSYMNIEPAGEDYLWAHNDRCTGGEAPCWFGVSASTTRSWMYCRGYFSGIQAVWFESAFGTMYIIPKEVWYPMSCMRDGSELSPPIPSGPSGPSYAIMYGWEKVVVEQGGNATAASASINVQKELTTDLDFPSAYITKDFSLSCDASVANDPLLDLTEPYTYEANVTIDPLKTCDCFFNDQGDGCNPFNEIETANPVTNFEWVRPGEAAIFQDGPSTWEGGLWIKVPINRTVYFNDFISLSQTNQHGPGRYLAARFGEPDGGFGADFLLDTCTGHIVGTNPNDLTESIEFDANDWSDCGTPSGLPPLVTGCCELANGKIQNATTEGTCDALGGTWTGNAACPPTGCCQISGSSDLSGVTEAYCTTQGGTWTQGAACDPAGWCIDDSTGAVTADVEENDCTGTWSATEPTMGCCDISGTEHPDVAQSWCASQSGTFTAGDCPDPPEPTFDPCGETFQIAVNLVTLDMDDPNFQCNSPFNLSAPSWLRGSADVDKDACSPQGVKAYTIGSSNEVYGDETNDPSALNQIATYLTVKYDSGSGTWTVTMVLSYQYGSTQTITASKSGISGSGFDCPSFTLSGSFDTFSGTYTTTCGGNQKDVNDMIGSFNITLTCE